MVEPGIGADRHVAHRGWWSATTALLVVAVLAAACSVIPDRGAGTAPPGSSGSVGTVATAGSVAPIHPPLIAKADLAAIHRSVDAINAGAGGPVADQRAVLDRMVVHAESAAQRTCAVAMHTIRLDPVYTDLRRPPPDQSTSTSDPGSTGPVPASPVPNAAASGGVTEANGSGAYLLPVLITIFTGDRITGTDLTTLRLFVTNGTAHIGHLCVT